jgi:hypothetical protein
MALVRGKIQIRTIYHLRAVRHKSAIDAYNLGYKFGREISS